jgi:hypothetical protein
MILLVHLLFGALIGQKIANPFLAVILAFLSHYLLDSIPHIEYAKIDSKIRRRDIILVATDLLTGILLIIIFAKHQPVIYICAFFAILPDLIYASSFFRINKFIKTHEKIHNGVHFLEKKKISVLWRIASQVVIVISCIALFRV